MTRFLLILLFGFFYIPLGAQELDDTNLEGDVSAQYKVADLPPHHPGHGKTYAQKDYDYWRWLSDEEWAMDPDNQRHMYDMAMGAYDARILELGGDPAKVKAQMVNSETDSGKLSITQIQNSQENHPSYSNSFLSMTDHRGHIKFSFVMTILCGILILGIIVVAILKKKRYD